MHEPTVGVSAICSQCIWECCAIRKQLLRFQGKELSHSDRFIGSGACLWNCQDRNCLAHGSPPKKEKEKCRGQQCCKPGAHPDSPVFECFTPGTFYSGISVKNIPELFRKHHCVTLSGYAKETAISVSGLTCSSNALPYNFSTVAFL